MARFSWGDGVSLGRKLIGEQESERDYGSVCGIRLVQTREDEGAFGVPKGTPIYQVEWEDGRSCEVPGEWLQLAGETDRSRSVCGLPEDVESTLLVEHQVVRICFSKHDLTLELFPEASIQIQAGVAVGSVDEPLRRFSRPEYAAAAMTSLLSRGILGAEGSKVKLRLRFEANLVLDVFNDGDQFQSFRIRKGESDFVGMSFHPEA